MLAATAYWLTTVVLAAAAWPFAARLFRRFPDAGAGLAPALASVVVALLFFWMRLARLAPAGPGGAALVVLVVAFAAVLAARYDRHLLTTFRRSWPTILVVLMVYSAVFFGFAWMRTYMSDIRGTEQPMDLMYLNAIMSADTFPPADPWFAGEPISYYYLGYIQAAIPTMLSGVAPSVGYTLSLAALFASSAVAAMSVALALGRWVLARRDRAYIGIGALAAVLLLLFAGSLSTWFHLASAHNVYNSGLFEAFGVADIGPCSRIDSALVATDNCHAGTGAWYPDKFWWWFDTSRVIPGTITEFPAFSFMLGDMHPHVMSIPGVLLAVGLAMSLYRGRSALGWRAHTRSPLPGIVLALSIAALAFVNTWDVITLWCLFGLAVVARNARHVPLGTALAGAVTFIAPATLAAVVLIVPWVLTFSSQADGFRAYVGAGTTPGAMVMQWGPLLALATVFLIWAAQRGYIRASSAILPAGFGLPIVLLLVWLVAAASQEGIGTAADQRGTWGWLTLVLLCGALGLLITVAIEAWGRRSYASAVAVLLGLGVLLLLGAELFLIRDVFYGSQPRLNTVFKLSYQAWIVLAIGGGVVTAMAVARMNRPGLVALAGSPAVALGLAALIYIPLVFAERSAGMTTPQSLDGLAWVQRSDPEEAALVDWVRNNVDRGTVILEAPGVSYQGTSRISSRTGRPTVLGWRGHELQWRGGSADAALQARLAEREAQVDRVYQEATPAAVGVVADTYGVEYVIVGNEELKKYGGDVGQRLAQVMDVVYEAGEYRILHVRDGVAPE